MIKVITANELEFKLYEPRMRKLYEESKDKITDTSSFGFILKNTLFYCFVNDGRLIGAIYFFIDKDKLFLNAYAERGYLADKIECVKMSLGWFKCDIYAEAQNRASALCLLRSGFRRVEGKLFVYKQQK